MANPGESRKDEIRLIKGQRPIFLKSLCRYTSQQELLPDEVGVEFFLKSMIDIWSCKI
jgi:hypothetical protein